MSSDADDRYVESCESCGAKVEAFTRECPGCGFDRSTFDEPEPGGPPWGFADSGRPRGPPCPECSQHMEAGAFGWGPTTGHTVDWATCEACGLGWGPWTGVVELEGES